MARKRRRAHWEAGELNLVAMIDVAFQLLNFFVITSHPVDVFTNLDVFRPAAVAKDPQSQVTDLLEIMIYKTGYSLEKKQVDLPEMERQLTKLASSSKTVPVIIKCTGDSSHERLVRILDICAKTGLTKISVFSL